LGQTIICPTCKAEIPLDEALTQQMREQVKNELSAETAQKARELKQREDAIARQQRELEQLKDQQKKDLEKRETELQKQFDDRLQSEREKLEGEAREKAEEKMSLEMKDLQAQLAEGKQKVSELEAQELKIRQEKRALEDEAKRLKQEAEDRIVEEVKKLEGDIKLRFAEQSALEKKDLQARLENQDKLIAEFRDQELKLRKEKDDLEQTKKNLEVEIARRLDAEKKQVQEETEKRLVETFRLKEAEKDKLISDMRDQMEEMRRKSEQGSQQLQGEVAELSLEELLKSSFLHDQIEEVPKGIRGADVIQRVCSPFGESCGTIIWESKRTKNWADAWVDKLKEDQREARADIAVIVSTVLPKGMDIFGNMSGVWVCRHDIAINLASALRMNLVQVAQALKSLEGKNEKMEMLYAFLSGPEFRQQVEGIVEAFQNMKADLDSEKRAMEKIWSKREKQIDRVVKNMGRMYGSMQGIIGRTMPAIGLLELEAIAEGNEVSEHGALLSMDQKDTAEKTGRPVSARIERGSKKDNSSLFSEES
jgi:hypothetical protein